MVKQVLKYNITVWVASVKEQEEASHLYHFWESSFSIEPFSLRQSILTECTECYKCYHFYRVLKLLNSLNYHLMKDEMYCSKAIPETHHNNINRIN